MPRALQRPGREAGLRTSTTPSEASSTLLAVLDWRPGTDARKGRARAALPAAFGEWLEQGGGPLTFEGGWRAGAPVSSSELWATIFSLAADASTAVARWSEVSRYSEGRSHEMVELQSAAIESLAPLLAQYACLLTRGDAVERTAAR